MHQTPSFHPASFRDPEGRIFEHEGRIFRTLSGPARTRMEAIERDGRLARLIETGWLLPSRLVPSPEAGLDPGRFGPVAMHHERLTLMTYPYEWSFDMLRDAASLTLDLAVACLESGLILKDATPFNVTLHKNRMVFLDTLSIDDYREGQPWEGYAQFCREFLYPLFLTAHKGVEFQPWLRGELNGLKTAAMSRTFGLWEAPFRGVLTHVHLQAFFERRFANRDVQVREKFQGRLFPKPALLRMLRSLRKLVQGLKYRAADSVWGGYENDNSYRTQDEEAKSGFVAKAARSFGAGSWTDLGCNAGKFSVLVGASGNAASPMVGLEADPAALNAFYLRIRRTGGVQYHPIVCDLMNPSPAMGWGLTERASLFDRVKTDGFLALALVHHLCISNNVPLDAFARLLKRFGGRGVVEWVDKSDPMVQKLLRNRRDVFPDYTWERFDRALRSEFRVEEVATTHDGSRRLCRVSS